MSWGLINTDLAGNNDAPGEVNCPLRTYNMKIGIIGFGAASIGFLSEVIDENHEIHILERSKDIFSSSISGIRSDGKIFVSDTMGGDMEIPLPIQKSVVDFYLEKLHSEDKLNVKTGTSFDRKSSFFDLFYEKGFEPVNSRFGI